MTDGQKTMTAPPPRRNVLLIVSLCLNVALVAMIAVAIVNAIHHPRSPGNALSPEVLKENATDSERAKIDAIFAAHAAKIRQLREDSRSAHRAALEMFSDSAFDPAAFENALGKAQTADDALRREYATVTAQSAAQLSPSERKAVADKARRRFMWWRFFRGGRHSPHAD